VLANGHELLGRAERDLATPADTARLEPVGTAATRRSRPVVVAVGATPDAALVVDAAAGVARDLGAPLEVVHVRETVVVEELAIDPEPVETARATLAAHLQRLTAAGTAAAGQLLHSVGDHAAAARVLAAHASEVDARTVAIGPSPRGPVAQFTDGSFTAALTAAATTRVLLLRPDEEPRELTTATLADLRA
jgi:MFS transporter, ACDE family, multidrug resistance protein